MSQVSNQVLKSFIAGAAVATKQYYACQIYGSGADNTVILAAAGAAEGAHVTGVIQDKPVSGGATSVCIGGTSKLTMAANCDRGEKIMSDGTGKGTPADGDTKAVIGIALESNAEGDGGIIEVQLTPGGVAQANESN